MKPSIERMASAYDVLQNLTDEERDIVLEPYVRTFQNASPPVVAMPESLGYGASYPGSTRRRKTRARAKVASVKAWPLTKRRKIARAAIKATYKRLGTYRATAKALGLSEGYARGIAAGRYIPSDRKLATILEAA